MSSFRTVELSDPAYEKDGLRFMTLKTPHLKGRGDICLFVPKLGKSLQNLPIYILLHGVYGSAWAWALKGGAHHMAQKLMQDGTISPAIIAMPSDGLWGDGSGYISHTEKDFEQWIVSDVPTAIKENIPEASDESILCIGGLSMGGYGALRLGAKHPHLFKAISAHSAITQFSEMAFFVEEPLDLFPVDDHEKNIIDIIKKNRDKLPPLRFDCGVADELINGNKILYQQLKELEVPHTYTEFEGGHEWSYWQKQLEHTLVFFNMHAK
ncbi:alpha/beta hydrolase [Maribacter sp. 2210JD10-5]|uniref:alpha/beta hydrolase n=1 Tax=Maribacter sp. 2210JD10-5 TaxID=3386272 RepID=UPI0039BD6E72